MQYEVHIQTHYAFSECKKVPIKVHEQNPKHQGYMITSAVTSTCTIPRYKDIEYQFIVVMVALILATVAAIVPIRKTSKKRRTKETKTI